MSVAPFQKPSPDWDMVTLVWAGTYLDGTPATGTADTGVKIWTGSAWVQAAVKRWSGTAWA